MLEDPHTPGQEPLERLQCAACCTIGMSDASAEGTITRTSTPRATARPSASIAAGSGRKYGFWIQIRSRAQQMAR